jgi:hypothetical protein
MATLTSEQFKESVLRKCRESAEMKEKFFEANAGTIETVWRWNSYTRLSKSGGLSPRLR